MLRRRSLRARHRALNLATDSVALLAQWRQLVCSVAAEPALPGVRKVVVGITAVLEYLRGDPNPRLGLSLAYCSNCLLEERPANWL